VPLPFYVAALLLLSLPYLTSITDIYVLRALHRVRVQLPVRNLQHEMLQERFLPSVFTIFFVVSERDELYFGTIEPSTL
jgi:hypothetical protein